jgi:methylthioribose-1-phosphate isomerase
MLVNGNSYRTIWFDPAENAVRIIDQRHLPHRFEIEKISNVREMAAAIFEMHLRGAIVIGAAAAFGMYLAAAEFPSASNFEERLQESAKLLKATRPTAVNLAWAVDRALAIAQGAGAPASQVAALLESAQRLAEDEVERSRSIGRHGADLIREISRRKGGATVNILTHCNAGWLACVDIGTATAPIYEAAAMGIDLHVWVDETRPRNQGALTAWELQHQGVRHTYIPDNAGGHLMQHGMVDIVIVGSDRTTRRGDVANKIGTYLKALAARESGVPFYVALPSSSFDWKISDGLREIEIEERDAGEIRFVQGEQDGKIARVLVPPAESRVANFGFDVTPAGLVTGIISERGVCAASEEGLETLYSEEMSLGK